MTWDLLKLVDRIGEIVHFLDDPVRSRITTDRSSWDEGVGWHGVVLTTNVVVVIAIDTVNMSKVNHCDCRCSKIEVAYSLTQFYEFVTCLFS